MFLYWLFQVPNGIVLNVARQTSTFMEDFQNEEEYVKRRLSDLQVSDTEYFSEHSTVVPFCTTQPTLGQNDNFLEFLLLEAFQGRYSYGNIILIMTEYNAARCREIMLSQPCSRLVL